jgi:hypothetical protein
MKRRVSPTVLALSLVLVGGASTTASAAAGSISIIGGDATASVVCGNVAAAKDLATRRGIALQKSDCTANSAGGDVTLRNVDIFISRAARSASPMNAALADLASGASQARVVTDVCKPIKSSPSKTTQVVQRNICWGKGSGGRAEVKGAVVGVVQHADGTVTRRTFSAASLPHDPGSATAKCANVVAQPEHQQDNCTSSGGGASFLLRNVTVVEHRPDGSSQTRPNIDVTVRGGKATSDTYCFNVTDGSGRVVQINHCTGTATGGDVTLSDVTIHTTA